MSAAAADRRDDVVRLLSDVPEGLSDGQLARALGEGVRPQTVNTLCRRMVAEGVVERVGVRPIRNRLVPPPATRRRRAKRTSTATRGAGDEVGAPSAAPGGRPAGSPALVPVDTPAEPAEPAGSSPEPPVTAPAEHPAAGRDDPQPTAEPVSDAGPEDSPAAPSAPEPGPATPAAAADAPAALPVRDVLQAWSRTVNVQAAVATWLHGRGATIRSVALEGAAARDLVARLEGSELHVEVTGWPPDGDRTHPTTIAADWFAAAARAAVRRRSARPGARIVVALPDTRRYRALAAAPDTGLVGAGAEVWFVDPGGSVETTTARG